MGATLKDRRNQRAWKTNPLSASSQWLPPRMTALYITTRGRTGGWLAEALTADSASQVLLEEAVGAAAGLARLRDEAFDAVLVSHEPGELDALDLIEGYRASGADDPIVVLGSQSEQEMAVLCYEVGADGYVCVHTTTTRNLIWVVARAIQRHHLLRENHLLRQAEQTRLQREHDEADRLLSQQRTLLVDLEALRRGRPCQDGWPVSDDLRPPPHLPPQLITHYRELLRTYVIMGSGNLACELGRLADLLVAAGLSAQQTMHLHLHVLEELVRGLGLRSTRHVMTRAGLLALEVMVHLAEGYRRRYRERVKPPSQRMLPGFE
jgi:DNA-binding NarL/FixJ family response regulator